MPAHMKKHHTEVANIVWHGNQYQVPMNIMEKFKVDEKTLSIDDVFGDIIDECGEAAALLKGLRHRENLTQVEFAEKISITQANLSAMENGKRTIGKDIAKRIAKTFNVDYRYFL